MLDPGKLIGAVWLPSGDTHLEEVMTQSDRSAWRDGKLTYQTYKLDAAMKYQPANRRRTCVDIGAHVGLWSMWLVDLFKEVHAFEALEVQHRHLFDRNVPAGNVLFHPYAIGDRAGSFEMRMRPSASCTSFMSRVDAVGRVQRNKRSDIEHEMTFESVDVEMRTLDSFALESVDFMKIDTEGFELYVVNGALETIRKWRPNIVLEQADLDIYYGHEPKAAMKVLEGLGMTCKEVIGPDHIMVWE